ncbi:HutD family protein [uncultured Microbacterium sp.]|uniref:HutD family protein n=1 Tax=uncultured Microbacterium sp. TaxID=191216 RepID=UPI002620E9B0|nr:HutD family protein [uncultured Microbacterium sp.]
MRMVRRFTGIAPQPWANGRGSTRVLFDDAAAGAWTWRISIADLAGPQPYSSLPGVQRFQLSLGPGDLTLRVNDASAVLHPLQWWGFAGEDRVTAMPDAAGLRALNLFARRDRWVGSLSTASDEEITVTGAGIDVAVALPGDVGGTVHAVAGRPVAPLDSMLLDPGATALEGAFAVLRLVPVR